MSWKSDRQRHALSSYGIANATEHPGRSIDTRGAPPEITKKQKSADSLTASYRGYMKEFGGKVPYKRVWIHTASRTVGSLTITFTSTKGVAPHIFIVKPKKGKPDKIIIQHMRGSINRSKTIKVSSIGEVIKKNVRK